MSRAEARPMSDKLSPFDAIFTETGLDPNEAAQRTMRPDLPRRFWEEVTLDEREGAFHILLDGRSAKTPGRSALASSRRWPSAWWRNGMPLASASTQPICR